MSDPGITSWRRTEPLRRRLRSGSSLERPLTCGEALLECRDRVISHMTDAERGVAKLAISGRNLDPVGLHPADELPAVDILRKLNRSDSGRAVRLVYDVSDR